MELNINLLCFMQRLTEPLKEYIKSKAENFDPIKEELTDEKRKLTDEEKKQIDVYAGLNTFII